MHHSSPASASGSLFHRVTGEGPPVVLIQGVGVHHTGWQPQLPILEPRFRCLVFDNRGVGRSAPVTGRFTIDDLAADVLQLMDGQGWQSAHLVGHSMGGQIALRVAQLQPGAGAQPGHPVLLRQRAQCRGRAAHDRAGPAFAHRHTADEAHGLP
jgi:pimeloyl-ACP methyl ester carboxylesterase